MQQPIVALIDSRSGSPWQRYIEEILSTEGFPWHAVVDLAETSLQAADLARVPVVIVGAFSLTTGDEELLLDYADRGGRLVCLRPPLSLAERIGLDPSPGNSPGKPDGSEQYRRTMNSRWLTFSSKEVWNRDFDAEVVQFHGTADLYRWTGDPTRVWAWLAPFRGVASRHPAVVLTPHGQGTVAVFTYDLVDSTVLFHQGRQDQASTGQSPDADGDGSFKPSDLFVNHLDETLVGVPQADLHQDLLTSVLMSLSDDQAPLPRLWHFPAGRPAVAFINGDSDDMNKDDLDRVLAIVDSFGARFTTYLMAVHHAEIAPEVVEAYRKSGHGFGQHAFTGPQPTLAEQHERLLEEHALFKDRYGWAPVSYRGHQVIWTGWVDTAKDLRECGVRLDTCFAPGRYYRAGYVTGSGLPNKFIDHDGTILDIYEQATMSTDDGWLTDKLFLPALTIDECIAQSIVQIDQALDQFHTVYHPYFHPHATAPEVFDTAPWLTAVLEYCRERDVLTVSDREWLDFIDARRSVALANSHYEPGATSSQGATLTFTLTAAAPVSGLAVLLPATHRGSDVQTVMVDGQRHEARVAVIEGRSQLMVIVDLDDQRQRSVSVCWGDD